MTVSSPLCNSPSIGRSSAWHPAAAGRRRKGKADAINPKQVEFLISDGLTVAEVAARLGISKKTVERRFKAQITSGRELLLTMRASAAEKMASQLATESEIAQALGISVDTLMTHFPASIKRGRALGACAMREAQWQSAMNGNVSMLIWLGKQYLGQSNNPQPASSSVENEQENAQREMEAKQQREEKAKQLAEYEQMYRDYFAGLRMLAGEGSMERES